MTVNGISGVNNSMQAGSPGRITQMDSVSKNIQNQIANAQKKLQELSSNEELSLEDKMKKRQEIQQEINNLNQQLRQHQMEQRKEQQEKKTSMDDMLGGSRKTAPKSGKQSAGLSQASMQAMISADSSMKQAQVQGSMATQMEGKAGVLESEIKMDKGRGASTEKKEEELADLQAKAQTATAAQVSTLADAGKKMEEAAKADAQTEASETKGDKTDKAQEKVNGTEENTENATTEVGTEVSGAVEVSVTEATETQTQQTVYTPIDIRL